MLDWINSSVWFLLMQRKLFTCFFGNCKLTVDICVKINKETINRVNVTKFLGVMIDDKLNWKNHICLVKSKLSKSCTVMYRASFLIDRRGMHIMYYSFLPYNMYCAEVWGNTYATNIKYFIICTFLKCQI